MFRFTNIMKFVTDVSTEATTEATLEHIDVDPMTAPVSPDPEEIAIWVANKIQNIVTVTIADIAGVAVRSLVGVGQDCNDAAKNLYKYLYHRYSQYNNDLVLLVTSFFQSTLSKTLAFTSLFNQIQTKQAANAADPTVFADFGKIARLLITFEPALVTGRLLATKDELAVGLSNEGLDGVDEDY